MYNLSSINTNGHNTFVHGVMNCQGQLNGLQARVMQSQEYLDALLKDFEKAIIAGYNPNQVKPQIFAKYGITEADLTAFDAQLLKKKVEAIAAAHNRMK